MTRNFAVTNGTVHGKGRAVRDPESGRLVMVEKRGGRVGRGVEAPLDPVIRRALDASRANRPAPVVWEDECPF